MFLCFSLLIIILLVSITFYNAKCFTITTLLGLSNKPNVLVILYNLNRQTRFPLNFYVTMKSKYLHL